MVVGEYFEVYFGGGLVGEFFLVDLWVGVVVVVVVVVDFCYVV